MKLSEAAALYENCFSKENSDRAGGCLYKDCPLHKRWKIKAGDKFDEEGALTWTIGGCTLLALIERLVKRIRKPELCPDEERMGGK